LAERRGETVIDRSETPIRDEPEGALLHRLLLETARRRPRALAVVHGAGRHTWADLERSARNVARWLQRCGVQRGDRGILLLENSPEWIAAYFGLLMAGAVAVPLGRLRGPDDLRALLGEVEPAVIVSSARSERLLRAADLCEASLPARPRLLLCQPRLPWADSGLDVTAWREVQGDPAPESGEAAGIDPDALACILFTSGSTGERKGVMLSHRNLVSNARSIIAALGLREDDVQQVVLPFHYAMGSSLLTTLTAVGGRLVLNNRFAYTADVVEQMIAEEVTCFSGVPSTYAYLLHRSPLRKRRHELSALRLCTQAGGHLSRDLKVELRRALPDWTDIAVMYGATEASARLTVLAPAELAENVDSIGEPIPDVRLAVCGPDDAPLPAGEIGELVAEGPNIMRGYWRDPVSTARVLRGGRYHTGDLGYADERGLFFVVGRRDAMLKVKGHRLHPKQVEEELVATGLVVEAVALGLPDALDGQRLVAVAVPVDGSTTPASVLARLRARAPSQMLPSELRLLRALPHQESGKIDRRRCAELFANESPSTQESDQ